HALVLAREPQVCRRRTRRRSGQYGKPQLAAKMLAQRAFDSAAELLGVQVLLVRRQHELPSAARVRLQVAMIGELTRRSAQIERAEQGWPVDVAARNAVALAAGCVGYARRPCVRNTGRRIPARRG